MNTRAPEVSISRNKLSAHSTPLSNLLSRQLQEAMGSKCGGGSENDRYDWGQALLLCSDTLLQSCFSRKSDALQLLLQGDNGNLKWSVKTALLRSLAKPVSSLTKPHLVLHVIFYLQWQLFLNPFQTPLRLIVPSFFVSLSDISDIYIFFYINITLRSRLV